MNNAQIMEQLAAFRPGHDDPAASPWREAFAALERDPALAEWYQRLSALDHGIGWELRNVTPPPGLKRALLENHPRPQSQFWSWKRLVAAVATAAAILAVTMTFWFRSHQTGPFQDYRAAMVKFVAHEYKVEVDAHSLAELQQKLATMGWPSRFRLPAACAPLELEGGCAMTWNGHRVTLVCMETEKEGDVWLFVAPRELFPELEGASTLITQTGGLLPNSHWVEDDVVYLLVVEGDANMLQRYLP